MKNLFFLLLISVVSLLANGQVHGPVIPIDSVNFVPDSLLNKGSTTQVNFKIGDTVTVEGIVTFNPDFYGMSSNRKATWLQANSKAPWTGINVFADKAPSGLTGWTYSGTLADLISDIAFYDNFKPGYTVKCTGVVNEFSANTQLNLIPIASVITDIPSNIDTTQPITPVNLHIDVFQKNDGSGGQLPQMVTGEPYEGMYVKFYNVTVVDVAANGASRYNWAVQDSAGNKIAVRDNSAYYRNDKNMRYSATWNYVFTPQTIGTRLEYIKGVIIKYNGNYMISPLLPTDIKVAASAPVVTSRWRIPTVPTSSQKVNVYAVITDNDGTISSASLKYSTGIGNISYTSVAMSKVGSTNVWKGEIPAQANETIVNYWIKAFDNSGLFTNYPDSLASGSMYKVLDNGIVKISEIQNTPFKSGGSIWNKDTVTNMKIHGIVTATLNQLSYVAVQDATESWSGILLKASSGDGLDALKLGDSIEISKAVVVEEFYVTTLYNAGGPNLQILAKNRKLPEPVKLLHPDSVNAKKIQFSEAYESMLIEFDDAFVVNKNPDAPGGDFGEWTIGFDTINNTGLRVDDQSSFIESNFNKDSLKMHQKLDFIKGILYYSFSNFKLLPRDKNDIYGYFTDTSTSIMDHFKANNFEVNIFPNPATEVVFLNGFFPKQENILIRVYDLNGKMRIQTEERVDGNFNKKLDLKSLSEGIYLVGIISENSGMLSKSIIKH